MFITPIPPTTNEIKAMEEISSFIVPVVFNHLLDTVAVVHEKSSVPCRVLSSSVSPFRQLGIGIVFDFDGNRVGVALAGNLVHHGRIGRPEHQYVGVTEGVFFFCITPMTVSGRFLKKLFLPKGSVSSPKVCFGVLVNHDDLRVFFHIALVKQAT